MLKRNSLQHMQEHASAFGLHQAEMFFARVFSASTNLKLIGVDIAIMVGAQPAVLATPSYLMCARSISLP